MTTHFSRGASLRQKTPPVCRSKSFEGDINTPPNGHRAIVSINIAPVWTYLFQPIIGQWFLGRVNLVTNFVKPIEPNTNPWILIAIASPIANEPTPAIITVHSFVAGILVNTRLFTFTAPPHANPLKWTERRLAIYSASNQVAGSADLAIG